MARRILYALIFTAILAMVLPYNISGALDIARRIWEGIGL